VERVGVLIREWPKSKAGPDDAPHLCQSLGLKNNEEHNGQSKDELTKRCNLESNFAE
jgi:hypothetical protein